MDYDMSARTVTIAGHGGDEIEAYLAEPQGEGRTGAVVLIHHLPGYDRQSKEMARRFAAGGYLALMPNLYSREAPGASPDDAAATVRASGGVPDDRLVGDVEGAANHLKSLSTSNGKVACIGHCSGGRQTFLSACRLQLDAAVDCYGGMVVGEPPPQLPNMVPVIQYTKDLSCPLLGLFGVEDKNPSPEHVAEMEKALKEHGKTYEFHSYEGAGHAFFGVDRSSYRVEAALDGWARIFEWFDKYLAASGPTMCTYQTEHVQLTGSGKGPAGWFALSDATVYFDHPVHAVGEHTLNIDFRNPAMGPSARVAVELDPASARGLAQAIFASLEGAAPLVET